LSPGAAIGQPGRSVAAAAKSPRRIAQYLPHRQFLSPCPAWADFQLIDQNQRVMVFFLFGPEIASLSPSDTCAFERGQQRPQQPVRQKPTVETRRDH